jgi:hypothetical protein
MGLILEISIRILLGCSNYSQLYDRVVCLRYEVFLGPRRCSLFLVIFLLTLCLHFFKQ